MSWRGSAGWPPPPVDVTWDQEAGRRHSTHGRDRRGPSRSIRGVSRWPAAEPGRRPAAGATAPAADLAILSNWPLAATIDRYVEAAGWAPFLRAIVVSQRVGVIKPHPGIFAEARRQLGDPKPDAILHVGDDWAADVVGASAVGWRVATSGTSPATRRCRPASATGPPRRTSRSTRSPSCRTCWPSRLLPPSTRDRAFAPLAAAAPPVRASAVLGHVGRRARRGRGVTVAPWQRRSNATGSRPRARSPSSSRRPTRSTPSTPGTTSIPMASP